MKLTSEIEVFEFKKTSRHESHDAKTVVVWDEFGKSFVIHGEKKATSFIDKERRSIRFFTMYGEPLLVIERLEHMNNFAWRPRPHSNTK
jgi:C4-type Zn-finger protein